MNKWRIQENDLDWKGQAILVSEHQASHRRSRRNGYGRARLREGFFSIYTSAAYLIEYKKKVLLFVELTFYFLRPTRNQINFLQQRWHGLLAEGNCFWTISNILQNIENWSARLHEDSIQHPLCWGTCRSSPLRRKQVYRGCWISKNCWIKRLIRTSQRQCGIHEVMACQSRALCLREGLSVKVINPNSSSFWRSPPFTAISHEDANHSGGGKFGHAPFHQFGDRVCVRWRWNDRSLKREDSR